MDVAPLITKVPGVCGGDACIKGTRVAVWNIETDFRHWLQDMLMSYPSLSADGIRAAIRYSLDNEAEIGACIAANEDVEPN